MARSNPIKSSLVLFGIAALIVAISYFFIAPKQKEKMEAKENSSMLYGGLKREDILSFEFTNEHGTFQLSREAKDSLEWILTHNQESFRADRDAVIGLISTLIASKRDEELEAPPLDQVGLENPKFSIKIKSSGDDKERTLLLGNDTPVNYFVYAKWSDQPDVFLTTRSIRFGVDKSLRDLRNKAPFDWKLSELKNIQFRSLAKAGLLEANFSITRKNSQWISSGPQSAEIDTKALEDWFGAFEKLKVQGFTSDDANKKASFNFSTPIATLTIQNEAGKEQTWRLSTKKESLGKGVVDRFYLDEKSAPATYDVTNATRDLFKLDFFQLRNKNVTRFDEKTVDKIRLDSRHNFIEFSKTADGWDATSNFKGFEKGTGNAIAIEKLLASTHALNATKYHDGVSEWTTGLKNPSRTIQFFKEGKVLEEIQVGKAVSSTESIVKTLSNTSPAGVLLNFEEVASIKAELFIEKSLPKVEAPPQNITSQKGGYKMEKTVNSLKELKKLPAAITKPGYAYSAEIQVAGKGKITIKFDAEKAPYTVSNFLHLARNGFYDGVVFHRVIKDFVAQGGDPTGNGTGGPGWIFDYEKNDLKHLEGAISMAHAQDPNTNGSQFFLVHKPQPHLDGVHTVFGYISSGLDTMLGIQQGDKMEKVEVFEKPL